MKSIYQQNSFVSGVLDPRLKGRTDIEQYHQGLQTGDNVFLLPQGGLRQAPGSIHIAEVNNKEGGGLSNVRMFNFPVSETRHYLVVITDESLVIFRDQEHLLNISAPGPTITADFYTHEEIPSINSAQLDNIMILTQPDRGFRRLVAPLFDTDDDANLDNWSWDLPIFTEPEIDYNDDLSPIPVSDVQQFTLSNFNEGETFKFILNGIGTEDIAWVPTFASLAVNIETAFYNHPLIVGDTGVTVVELNPAPVQQLQITFSGQNANDWQILSGYGTSGSGALILFVHTTTGSSQKEPAWSVDRGYPRCITFYNGRTYLGNLPYFKSTLFGSVSGDLLNFKLGPDDDEAIRVTLATDKLNEITNLVSGRQLQIFTLGAEFFVPTEIPTPSDFTIRAQTNHGTSFVNPVQIDGSTMFLERKGKTLRDFVFTFQEDSYLANSISVLAQHLIIDPVDMDAQKGTQSDDANYVFLVNSDGTLAVLNTLRSQGIAGFTKRVFPNGKAVAVCVVDDIAHCIIERDIDGNVDHWLEYFSFDSLLDASFKNTYGSPETVITGLSHLEGQTVKVVADNSVLADNTVFGGQITIEREATTVDVGLWQSPIIQPMPLVGQSRSGNTNMKLSSNPRTSLRLYETKALRYDGVTIPIKQFGTSNNSPLNSQPQLFTGIVGDLESQSGWEREKEPVIDQEQPGPFTVLAINYELESR